MEQIYEWDILVGSGGGFNFFAKKALDDAPPPKNEEQLICQYIVCKKGTIFSS
jgi:hypothetical protein